VSTGHRPSRLRPALAAVPAVLFSAWALLYMSALLLAGGRPDVELGFNLAFRAADRAVLVTEIFAGSPAERAGLRTGDAIVAIDGRPIENERTQAEAWMTHRAGDTVRLTVRRPGVAVPFDLVGTFRWRSVFGDATSIAQRVQGSYPVPFVLVGVVLLFLRLGDRYAWLLALLFGSFAAIPGFPDDFATVTPALRPAVTAYRALGLGLVGPLFYVLFTTFPAASPIDRRVPSLKWAGVIAGVAIALPGIGTGQLRLPAPLAAWLGAAAPVVFPGLFVFSFLVLGLVSLAASYTAATRNAAEMRKIRVIFWGTVVGVIPGLATAGAGIFFGVVVGTTIDALASAALYLMPLSFAYAVMKQRVLDVPVLLRRSARYLLVQRGFTFLLSVVSIALTLVFAAWVGPRLQQVFPVTAASAVTLGAVFGTALLWSGTQVHRRVGRRIDRAFFRSAYDAQLILEDLAQKSGAATDRETLARLLERHLADAFHPAGLAIYLEGRGGDLDALAGTVPPGLERLPAERAEQAAAEALRPLQVDCVVPVKRPRGAGPAGLIVLGPRRSDEPYSREDRRLLESVAGQAGTALENICLAEEIAARIEAARRAAREMDIARDVQARLLPERPPPLDTLDCAARCVQARAVGGDCYDFLELGAGQAGFVLADVSGKGLHAALLMANLQAHLRSQSSAGPDPLRVLREVNRLIFRSTATQHYATVFLGVYDEASRTLRYVNGGHLPPVLLRADRRCPPVRLAPTARAVGLFEDLDAHVEQVSIGAGDLLAVFSDGITEATRGDEEFGDDRLVAQLADLRDQPADAIVAAVLASVQEFSEGAQSDDLTLLIVRGR
jgi:phosphoserine phosphatase RsbU/P